MHGRDIWSMIDEINPNLEKLAEEPYVKIREYELNTQELKEGDFDLNKFKQECGYKSLNEIIKGERREN